MAIVGETQRKAKRYMEDSSEQLTEQIDSAIDYLNSLSDQLGRTGGRQLKRARRRVAGAAHEADSVLRDNPYAAVGAALTLGVLFGLLLARR